jgi:hypothetical protein
MRYAGKAKTANKMIGCILIAAQDGTTELSSGEDVQFPQILGRRAFPCSDSGMNFFCLQPR